MLSNIPLSIRGSGEQLSIREIAAKKLGQHSAGPRELANALLLWRWLCTLLACAAYAAFHQLIEKIAGLLCITACIVLLCLTCQDICVYVAHVRSDADRCLHGDRNVTDVYVDFLRDVNPDVIQVHVHKPTLLISL
jgi:hypothetical protein